MKGGHIFGWFIFESAAVDLIGHWAEKALGRIPHTREKRFTGWTKSERSSIAVHLVTVQSHGNITNRTIG